MDSTSLPNADTSLYTTLGDWQTRVLAIRPGQFGQTLIADLHVVDIVHGHGVVIHSQQQRIEYKALSYCWGNPIFGHTITCNDEPFHVTANLYAGLQRVRSEDDVLYIWIDAICINQHDISERSSQVSNMLTIYSKAEGVIVWLGEMADRMSTSLLELASFASKTGSNYPPRDSKTTRMLQICGYVAANPWFRRIWVRQEVWAASSLTVRQGHESIEWSALMKAFQLADAVRIGCIEEKGSSADVATARNSSPFTPIITGFLRPAPRSRIAVALGDEKNTFLAVTHEFDIRTVLSRSVGSLCSDPRDMVYGLLGMSSTITSSSRKPPSSSTSFVVDYERNVSQVFQDVARYIMERDGVFNILYLDAFFGGNISGLKLPSWCPNWSRKNESGSWIFNPGSVHLDLDRYEHTAKQHPEDGCLEIQGLNLGTIETLLPEASDELVAAVVNLPLQAERAFEDAARPNAASSRDALQTINHHLSQTELDAVMQELNMTGSLSFPVDFYSQTVLVEIPRSHVVFRNLVRRPAPIHAPISKPLWGEWPGVAPIQNDGYLKVTNNALWLQSDFLTLFRAWISRKGEDENPLPEAHSGSVRNPPTTTTTTTTSPHPLQSVRNTLLELQRTSNFSKFWTAPPTAQKGDIIIAPRGGFHPIVLRQLQPPDRMLFVGPTIMSTVGSPLTDPKTDTPYTVRNQMNDDQVRRMYRVLDLAIQYEHERGALETYRLM